MARLVYENIGIGAILQRLGECRYANRYFTNPSMMLTQQVKKLEEKFRDVALTVDSKLLAIEFKAPILNNNILKYENIEVSRLLKIADFIGEENVMIALIHAALPNSELKRAKSSGTYLWLATPGTTVYVPLEQINQVLNPQNQHKQQQKIDIEVLDKVGYINIDYVNTLFPTCAKQGPLTRQEPHCASCGGLYSGPNNTRRITLEVQLIQKPKSSTSKGNVISYTLASLIKEFAECKIGREVDEELLKRYTEIIKLITPKTMLLALHGKEAPLLLYGLSQKEPVE